MSSLLAFLSHSMRLLSYLAKPVNGVKEERMVFNEMLNLHIIVYRERDIVINTRRCLRLPSGLTSQKDSFPLRGVWI